MVLVALILSLVLGLAFAFAGYRLFLALLPIWGFFAGFILGTDAMAALFGSGFMAEVLGIVVGLVVAVVFAVLSYLFFYIGVAIVAAVAGYALGVWLMSLIGLGDGFLAFLVGVVVAIALIIGVFALRLPKVFIILLTAMGGAALTISGALYLFGNETFMAGLATSGAIAAAGPAIRESWFWMLIYLVIVVAGFVVQWQSNRAWELKAPPNRI
jgi:hypothetical protein